MRIIDFKLGEFFFNTTSNHILEMIWLNDKNAERRKAQVFNHTLKRGQFLGDLRNYHPLDRYRKKWIGKSIKPRHKKQLSFYDNKDFFN